MGMAPFVSLSCRGYKVVGIAFYTSLCGHMNGELHLPSEIFQIQIVPQHLFDFYPEILDEPSDMILYRYPSALLLGCCPNFLIYELE